ncbi:MAG: hypothetical protein QOE90_1514 [Thermoplasmata archaeon]|jgi:hypothetical protein|nr:hypothetical protein [Thermoplasmata archaeon]
MPWEPIKIDAPKKRDASAEERAANARQHAQKQTATAVKEPRLDAFLAASCPLRAQLRADPSVLSGRRAKCLQPNGEHVCVLAGPAPPRPGHTTEHRCLCGASWSVT